MAIDLNQPINTILAGLDARVTKLEGAASGPAALPSGMSFMWDAASLSALTDGAAVTKWTDGTMGLVAAPASGTGPTYRASALGGKPGVRFDGTQTLPVTTTSASDTVTNGANWTAVVIASGIDWTQTGIAAPTPVGSFSGTGPNNFWPVLGAPGIKTQGQASLPAQTGSGLYVCAWELSSDGRAWSFANGTAYQQLAQGGFAGALCLGGLKDGFAPGNFVGTLHKVIFYPRALSQVEVAQVQKHACDLYGQPYPWAARSNFLAYHGDSLTFGAQASDQVLKSYPYLSAQSLNRPLGTWSNLGFPGDGYDGMETSAQRHLDGLHAVTGITTAYVGFEWYNQANYAQAGDVHARAVTFLQARKTADPTMKIVFGTSTDANSAAIQPALPGRANYNSYFDTAANRSGLIDGYAAIHTNTNIGVSGAAAGPVGTATTYFQSDRIHGTDAFYSELAGVVSPAITTAGLNA